MNESDDACDVDEGPNCASSPVDDYVWLGRRLGRKLRTLVGDRTDEENR
ncbi:hypothetical protein [Haladaptatus sp. NG-WS-4]